MTHFILAGLEQQLSVPFVIRELIHSENRITLFEKNKRIVDALWRHLRTTLAAHHTPNGKQIDDMLERLHVLDSPLPSNAHSEYFHTNKPDVLILFPTKKQISALINSSIQSDAGAMQMASIFSHMDTIDYVHVTLDKNNISMTESISDNMNEIKNSILPLLPKNASLRLFLFDNCIDETGVSSTFSNLDMPSFQTELNDVVRLLRDVRYRSNQYFDRYPPRISIKDCHEFRLMTTTKAVEFLAEAHLGTAPGCQIVCGQQVNTITKLIDCIAMATNVAIQTTSTGVPTNQDHISRILSDKFCTISHGLPLDTTLIETLRSEGAQVHEILPESIDLRAICSQMATSYKNEEHLRQRKFVELPGLEKKSTHKESLQYFSYGTGSETILIVNAFGLSLDFWQMLISLLGNKFKIIAIEKIPAINCINPVSQTYYSVDNYAVDYISDISTVMAMEGIDHCHVLSWCGGAKLAMELTCAAPAMVKSLTLVTPSFAGMEGFAGSDSSYEKNLHTMCKLVNKMPKTAGSMASNMMAIMEKSSKDFDRFIPGNKDSVDVLGLVDDYHLPLVYQPFSSAENLIEFSNQLIRFRSHDVTKLLQNTTLKSIPIMLMTGTADATTSSDKAKDICKSLNHFAEFELPGGSHYIVHQNYEMVCELIEEFMMNGIENFFTKIYST
jgi:pimeloyl-ACP methyl ester carboxylesterase